MQKKIIIWIYISFLISILILINILFNTYKTDWINWPKWLNNTFLDNNSVKYGCQIIFPKRCPYNIFTNYSWSHKINRKKCQKLHLNAKQRILKLSNSPYINDRVNHIGYPLTNKNQVCNFDYIDIEHLLEKFIFKNLVDMENKDALNKYYKNKIPEVEVDFSKKIYMEKI